MITKRENLEDYIIKILAKDPFKTAKELAYQIQLESEKNYSIQGLYKELKQLQDEGVLFKLRNKYSLRLPWVLDYISFADLLAKTYVERPQLTTLLPEIGKKEIWHFSNLLKMNDFWSHLLLILIEKSADKRLLGYNPHPWFHLVQTDKEEQYIKSLKLVESKLYLIIGGNTFLDQWTKKFWGDDETIEYSFGKSDFHKERSLYLNVVDDYVITVKLDQKLSQAIDTIYDQTNNIDSLDIPSVISLFSQGTKASIWLEKNPEKAKKIRVKFTKFWGIDFCK